MCAHVRYTHFYFLASVHVYVCVCLASHLHVCMYATLNLLCTSKLSFVAEPVLSRVALHKPLYKLKLYNVGYATKHW